MTLTIRPTVPGEAETLTRIALASKRSWGYDDALIALWGQELRITEEDIASGEHTFAAEMQGKTVGWYRVALSEPVSSLEACWVEPDSMGHGVGRAMMQHAVDLLRTAGVSELEVESDPNAEGFYRRFGFVRIGERPSRPAGRMLPLMRLRLS